MYLNLYPSTDRGLRLRSPILLSLRQPVPRCLALGQELGRFISPGSLDLVGPGLEILLRDGLHFDRHVSVVLTAQLRALAVICAFLIDPDPVLVEPAGNRVDLEAERRHR